MLNWWVGRPADGSRGEDEDSQLEPPETPAPVFAARALRSAFFGTPAPPDDTIYDIETNAEGMASKDVPMSQQGSRSPMKPQGILLTPGTATSRRKTVSFDTEVVDKEENISEAKVPHDGNGDRLRKLEISSRPVRKTPLTMSLENAREGRSGKGASDRTRRNSESQLLLDIGSGSGSGFEDAGAARLGKTSKSQNSNQELMDELITRDDFDGDVTMDLNDPHSHSGKYWKTECEHYQEDAKLEMSKLIKYKQLAKSYAKKKDAEAIGLMEKLKDEQRKVVSMEDKISRLSARITNCCLEGTEENSPELIKELAQQTALAVQYRAQVEEFRVALEGNVEFASGKDGKRFTSPRTEQTLVDTHQELKKSREQLREIKSLREEVTTLQQTLSKTEKANLKLREENTKLTQELLRTDFRLEKQMEKAGKRRSSSEGHIRKKDEALQSLQKDYDTLKEQAKAQRRDAEHLLKNRHEQAVGLKKELAAMKGVESSARDLQITLDRILAEHGTIVAGYLKQISQLKEASNQGEDEVDRDSSKANRREKREIPAHFEPLGKTSSEIYDSLIPVPSQSISRPLKSMAPSRNSRVEKSVEAPTPKDQPSHSALSEINNNVNHERLAVQKSELVRFTPQTDRFSNLSLGVLELNLPSAEPSPQVPTRAGHATRCHASPRPSMFNISSSPPKPVMICSRDDELPRQRSNRDLAGYRPAYISSSRLSSLQGSRARSPIPPERAAAAKARLQQKNAEKKRVQAMGAEKENVRN